MPTIPNHNPHSIVPYQPKIPGAQPGNPLAGVPHQTTPPGAQPESTPKPVPEAAPPPPKPGSDYVPPGVSPTDVPHRPGRPESTEARPPSNPTNPDEPGPQPGPEKSKDSKSLIKKFSALPFYKKAAIVVASFLGLNFMAKTVDNRVDDFTD